MGAVCEGVGVECWEVLIYDGKRGRRREREENVRCESGNGLSLRSKRAVQRSILGMSIVGTGRGIFAAASALASSLPYLLWSCFKPKSSSLPFQQLSRPAEYKQARVIKT